MSFPIKIVIFHSYLQLPEGRILYCEFHMGKHATAEETRLDSPHFSLAAAADALHCRGPGFNTKSRPVVCVPSGNLSIFGHGSKPMVPYLGG